MKKTKQEEIQAVKEAPAYENRVTLIGFLGDKPEQREGHVVLSLATKTWWTSKDSSERQERTEWHRISAWGYVAETVGYLDKGDHVLVEGELRSHQFEKVVEGAAAPVTVQIRAWEVRARVVRKLERRSREGAAA